MEREACHRDTDVQKIELLTADASIACRRRSNGTGVIAGIIGVENSSANPFESKRIGVHHVGKNGSALSVWNLKSTMKSSFFAMQCDAAYRKIVSRAGGPLGDGVQDGPVKRHLRGCGFEKRKATCTYAMLRP